LPAFGVGEFRHPLSAWVPDYGSGLGADARGHRFHAKLYVMEIHGYIAAEGLKLVHPDALAKLTTADRR
jgi:hypothetical protein